MRRVTILGVCLGLLVVAVLAAAMDVKEELVELDRAWGSSTDPEVVGAMLADDLIAIGPDGLGGKQEQLEALADAPTGPYEADGYEVRQLGDDVAVMVHRAADPEHYSLHVWQKSDGAWKVVASANVPVQE